MSADQCIATDLLRSGRFPILDYPHQTARALLQHKHGAAMACPMLRNTTSRAVGYRSATCRERIDRRPHARHCGASRHTGSRTGALSRDRSRQCDVHGISGLTLLVLLIKGRKSPAFDQAPRVVAPACLWASRPWTCADGRRAQIEHGQLVYSLIKGCRQRIADDGRGARASRKPVHARKAISATGQQPASNSATGEHQQPQGVTVAHN